MKRLINAAIVVVFVAVAVVVFAAAAAESAVVSASPSSSSSSHAVWCASGRKEPQLQREDANWVENYFEQNRRNGAAATAAKAAAAASTAPEFCCCSRDAVNKAAPSLLNLLNNITLHPFFRYFKSNLARECPYWVVNLLCGSSSNPCQVCKCDPKDVPSALLSEGDMGTAGGSKRGGMSGDVQRQPEKAKNKPEFSPLSDSLFAPACGEQQKQEEENERKDAAGDEEKDDDLEYVDLIINPEANTAYVGELANRIWKEVYESNCFPLIWRFGEGAGEAAEDSSEKTKQKRPNNVDGSFPDVEKCTEQAVFYRLLSGLHASISTHLSVFFHAKPAERKMKQQQQQEDAYDVEQRTGFKNSMNCPEFKRRVLDHPTRIENLHLLYQFLLRAVTRAGSTVLLRDKLQYATNSSNPELDESLWRQMNTLLREELLCTRTFDDTKFIELPRSRMLIPYIQGMMHNITTLLDCLTCEKCRLWGKVQTKGVLAAFKILVSSASASTEEEEQEKVSVDSAGNRVGVVENDDGAMTLTRSELVALINLLRQVSVSIDAVSKGCEES